MTSKMSINLFIKLRSSGSFVLKMIFLILYFFNQKIMIQQLSLHISYLSFYPKIGQVLTFLMSKKEDFKCTACSFEFGLYSKRMVGGNIFIDKMYIHIFEYLKRLIFNKNIFFLQYCLKDELYIKTQIERTSFCRAKFKSSTFDMITLNFSILYPGF